MFSCIADLGLFDDPSENEQDSSPDVFDKLWDKVVKLWSHFYWRFIMEKFTINGKEYTHNELNLIFEFFTLDKLDSIITHNSNDKEIVESIQQLWRSSY